LIIIQDEQGFQNQRYRLSDSGLFIHLHNTPHFSEIGLALGTVKKDNINPQKIY